MFKKILGYFKKPEEEPEMREIELSKIDKYVNLILRHSLSSNNKIITDQLADIESRKESIMQQLHGFHKKTLMNPNIPQREIQIMEGNRDNFVKTVSHFVSAIDIPKNYVELFDYCVAFSERIEGLYKTTQKNTFILSQFFGNEVKAINSDLNKIEQTIINIRVTFERHKIISLKEVMDDVKEIMANMTKISSIQSEINDHEASMKEYDDKIKKLEERIKTITSGTDYRALEDFKDDKEKTQQEIIKVFHPVEEKFLSVENALRKYFYKNPDKKILREYFDDRYKALLNDDSLSIVAIFEDLKTYINNDSIDLKDKKKEQTLEYLESLNSSFLKEVQSQLMKLEDAKQHLQTKITHNSASLNLSEQQYWINANKEKMIDHKKNVEKLNGEIAKIQGMNDAIKKNMKEDIEKLFMENIRLIDDLSNPSI